MIGLHFAGIYLDANFAVPTCELARDRHVMDLRLNFGEGARPEASVSEEWWRGVQPSEQAASPSPSPQPPQPDLQAPVPIPPRPARTVTTSGPAVTVTIPLEISVRLGNVQVPSAAAEPGEAVSTEAAG